MSSAKAILTKPNIISFVGQINHSYAPDLFIQSKQLLNEIDSKEVIVDFSETTKLNSTSVSLILSLIRDSKKQSKTIKIINKPQEFDDIVEVSNLESIIKLHEGYSDAV